VRQLPLGIRVPDRAVFASFFEGSNAEALSYVSRIAAGAQGGVTWLCGPNGAGKTHLLQASCVAADEGGVGGGVARAATATSAQSRGEMRAGYFPLRELSSLGVGILEGLPEIDCVCLDDIDAVAGRDEWERALFALYRETEDRGGRLLASAVAPPALLPWSLPDLGSRFSASTIFQLRVLDEDEQRQALQLRARVRGFELPDETARWLQRRFPRDMRTLYELLDTLDEAALVAQRRLTIPFIRSVLGSP